MKVNHLEKISLTPETLYLFNEENLLQIFKLIYNAAPEFYKIFLSDNEDKNLFLELFKNQVVIGSELEEITIYSLKNEPVGVSVCYETSLNTTKRQSSAFLLLRGMRQTADTVSKLRHFDLNFPVNTIPNGAKYLSRIAVLDKCKGMGVSDKIFQDICLDNSQYSIKNLYLHVHRQNERAIKFYNKMKMRGVTSSQQNSSYDVMEGSLI